MKKYFLNIIILTYTLTSFSQGVGINNDGSIPTAGTMLDIKSSTDDNTTYGLQIRNNSGSSILSVRSDGNVGIGTTAPSASLDVIGEAFIDGIRTDAQITAPSRPDPDNDYGLIFNSGNGGLFHANGTTAPFKLHLQDGHGRVHYLWNVEENSNTYQYSVSNEGASWFVTDGGFFTFRTAPPGTAGNAIAWNTGIRQDTSGRVGIGTTTPSALFDVAGKTETSSLQVTTGATTNYVLTSDANGNATWQDPNGLVSADITAVNAGTGLTGGGSSGSVALGITTATDDDITNRAPSSTGLGSGFYQSSTPTTAEGWPENSSWFHLINSQHSNTSNNFALQLAADFFDQQLYFRSTNNNGNQAWGEVWHSLSDGAGSGLDADLLDGFNSSDFITTITAGDGLTGGGSGGSQTINVTARNGLRDNANDIELGGTLDENTTITQGNFGMIYNMTGSGDFEVRDNGSASLFVGDNGIVGIGTNSPGAKLTVLHTSNTTASTTGRFTRSGTGAAGNGLFFTHGSAAGDWNTMTQTGDIGIFFDRDGNSATASSTAGLIIAPHSQPALGATGIKIVENGNVGMGVGVPVHPLHMKSGARVTAAGVWTNASDKRLKKNISDLEQYGLSTVLQLRPRSYNMKTTNEKQIGFIAQEVLKIIPEVISTEGETMGLSYGQLVPVLVNAIKEQQQNIENLEKNNNELKALKVDNTEMYSLKNEINELKTEHHQLSKKLEELMGIKAEK